MTNQMKNSFRSVFKLAAIALIASAAVGCAVYPAYPPGVAVIPPPVVVGPPPVVFGPPAVIVGPVYRPYGHWGYAHRYHGYYH
jgi:hypothetical protein